MVTCKIKTKHFSLRRTPVEKNLFQRVMMARLRQCNVLADKKTFSEIERVGNYSSGKVVAANSPRV